MSGVGGEDNFTSLKIDCQNKINAAASVYRAKHKPGKVELPSTAALRYGFIGRSPIFVVRRPGWRRYAVFRNSSVYSFLLERFLKEHYESGAQFVYVDTTWTGKGADMSSYCAVFTATFLHGYDPLRLDFDHLAVKRLSYMLSTRCTTLLHNDVKPMMSRPNSGWTSFTGSTYIGESAGFKTERVSRFNMSSTPDVKKEPIDYCFANPNQPSRIGKDGSTRSSARRSISTALSEPADASQNCERYNYAKIVQLEKISNHRKVYYSDSEQQVSDMANTTACTTDFSCSESVQGPPDLANGSRDIPELSNTVDGDQHGSFDMGHAVDVLAGDDIGGGVVGAESPRMAADMDGDVAARASQSDGDNDDVGKEQGTASEDSDEEDERCLTRTSRKRKLPAAAPKKIAALKRKRGITNQGGSIGKMVDSLLEEAEVYDISAVCKSAIVKIIEDCLNHILLSLVDVTQKVKGQKTLMFDTTQCYIEHAAKFYQTSAVDFKDDGPMNNRSKFLSKQVIKQGLASLDLYPRIGAGTDKALSRLLSNSAVFLIHKIKSSCDDISLDGILKVKGDMLMKQELFSLRVDMDDSV